MSKKSANEVMTRCLIALPVAMVVTLCFLGRSWWCPQGDAVPWSLDIWSPHNSQHLFDAYSLSHIQHGISLFLLLSMIGKQALGVPVKVVLVGFVEVAWEILENTPLIINRYREATISLDYYGDSISNSVSDYLMCMLGVLLVHRSGWKIGIGLFIALESLSLFWVRDSLILNVIMLVAPNDVIRQWQVQS